MQKPEITCTGLFFFTNGVLNATWISRIPQVQQTLHLSNRDLGLALLGSALGCLLANAVAARCTDRWGTTRVATAAGVAMGTVLPLLAWAPSWTALFVATLLVGLCGGGLNVAQNARAAQVERQEGRPLMVSFHALFSVGGLVGAVLGAAMAGLGISPIHHLVAVSVLMGTCVLCCPQGESDTSLSTSVAGHEAHPLLATLALLAFCTVLSEGAMGDWSGIYMTTVIHTSAAVGALAFAAFSLAMVLGRCCGDRLCLHWGEPAMLRRGGLMAASGLGAALLAGQWPLFQLLGFSAVGFGCAGTYPILARAAGSTRAIAVVSSAGFLGYLAGPPLIGLAASHTGLSQALGLVVLANLVVSHGSKAVR